jgi:hypothetical protein
MNHAVESPVQTCQNAATKKKKLPPSTRGRGGLHQEERTLVFDQIPNVLISPNPLIFGQESTK